MNMTTKNQVFSRYLAEYLSGSQEEKGVILTQVCSVTEVHRKSAIRKFGRMQLNGSPPKKVGRTVYYTPDTTYALKVIWEAASEVCGELVFPMIGEYVAIFKRDIMWGHSSEATEKLLKMSEATVKRRVGGFMNGTSSRRGISATSPSKLKEIIPIFTGPWRDKPPGFGQIDTVVHCGSSLTGDMAFSVNYTDISTLWVSFSAQWNKGQQATRESLKRITGKVPFPILGMHPDTGGEFINWYVKGWTDEMHIELTRSRPYHKNDNAYVEQKNGHVIRRFLGYTRFDHQELISLMNEYYDTLELYLNHFVATKKCLKKVRVGSKYKRTYDMPTPPYRRVLKSPDISQDVKDCLILKHETLNPLRMKRRIDMLKSELLTLTKRLSEPLPERSEKVSVG